MCTVYVCVQYITMYGEMGKQSNTMIFADRPADVNALLAQASKVISGALGSSAPATPLSVGGGSGEGASSTSMERGPGMASYEDLLGDKYTGRAE